MSLIVIDYDGTYTTDPETWGQVVELLKTKHEVICVTMRHKHEPIEAAISCDIHYTGRKAKMRWCHDNGLIPDIWIDDNPHWIMVDAA